MNLYKVVFEAFEKAKINYLLVGGVAVNLYGYNRFTGDIDIILGLDAENLIKMSEVMGKLGYAERIPVQLKELNEKGKWEKLMQEKRMKAYTFISNDRPQLDIDIIVSESLDFDRYVTNRTIIEIWDLELPLVGIDDLIGMKRRADREKDKLDIEALLKLKEL